MENARSPKPNSGQSEGLHFQDGAAKLCYSRARQAGQPPSCCPTLSLEKGPGCQPESAQATRPLTQSFPAVLGAESRLRHSRHWDDPHSTVSFAPSKRLSQCL